MSKSDIRRYLSLIVLVCAALLGACGGQSGGSLGLRWVKTDIMVADLDGDGRADILTLAMVSDGGHREGRLGVYQQTAAGTYAAPTMTVDGRPDLLASLSPSSLDYTATLVVVQQTPARGFGAPIYTSLGGVLGNLDAVFADLTGDGVVDAAVAGYWLEYGGPLAAPNVRSRTNLLQNNGNGVFSLWTVIEMPVAVSRLTAGDLNDDRRGDIVAYGDEQCLVMFQSATPGTFLAPSTLR